MPEDIEKVFGAIAGNSGAVNMMESDRAPTVNDDASLGYSAASVWFKRNTSDWWTCSDATVGAAVWNELTSGGGVDNFPTTDRIALFRNAGSNYSSGVWTDDTDSDMQLTGITNASVNGSNRLASSGSAPANLDFNANLLAALSGVDNVSFVFGLLNSNGGILNISVVNGLFSQGVQAPIGSATESAVFGTYRGAGYQDATTGASGLPDDAFNVVRGVSPRGGTVYIQVDDGSKNEGDAVSDAQVGTVTQNYGAFGSTAGRITEIGFIAIFAGDGSSGILSDGDYATILSLVDGNADYGNG